MAFTVRKPEQKKCKRRNKTGCGRNRKSFEFLTCSGLVCSGTVKSGEPQRAAGEIDKRHDPAGARKLLEHDPINQECGCEAERNNVGKRIELAAERTVVTTQSRQSAIEEIKNEGAKNKPDRGVKKIGGNIRV